MNKKNVLVSSLMFGLLMVAAAQCPSGSKEDDDSNGKSEGTHGKTVLVESGDGALKSGNGASGGVDLEGDKVLFSDEEFNKVVSAIGDLRKGLVGSPVSTGSDADTASVDAKGLVQGVRDALVRCGLSKVGDQCKKEVLGPSGGTVDGLKDFLVVIWGFDEGLDKMRLANFFESNENFEKSLSNEELSNVIFELCRGESKVVVGG